jgi:hypothetical protein
MVALDARRMTVEDQFRDPQGGFHESAKRSAERRQGMIETTIIRLVDDGIAETVAKALEDFKGMVVTITIKEAKNRKPQAKKGEANHAS